MKTAKTIALAGVLVALLLPLNVVASAEDWRWQSVERVVVVPDIHGAYPALVQLLQATGVIDQALSWVGGETHLVSLGDFLDRGGQSRAVMDLLMRLQREATEAGGRVHVLLGNHEHMNLVGDLRYVADAEYQAFIDDEDPRERAAALQRFVLQIEGSDIAKVHAAFAQRYPPGYFGHRAAFRAEGFYGRWLLSLPTMVIVNDSVFVHAGLSKLTIQQSAARLNRRFSDDLVRYLEVWHELVAAGAISNIEPVVASEQQANEFLAQPSGCVAERTQDCEKESGDQELQPLLREFKQLSAAEVHDMDSPLWYRGSVHCRNVFERPILEANLEHLNVNRLIIGHTPTQDSRVHVIHDGRVIMADTGMLVSYYKGRPAALVLQHGKVLVQYLNPAERIEPDIGRGPLAYGLDANQLTQALKSGEIESIQPAIDGSSKDVIVRYAGQLIRSIFYPNHDGKADTRQLAAHALDQLLGTQLVPPTVPRRINGAQGALQLVYPDLISELKRRERGLGFSGWCSMARQFELMTLFDLLTGNRSRTANTVYYRQANWSLQLLQHQQAFKTSRRLPGGLDPAALSIPPALRASLLALDKPALQAALGRSIGKRRISALLARRDALLKLYSE